MAAVTPSTNRRPARDGEAPSEPLWQPRIVAFFCHWCAYSAADLAGVDRRSHSADLRVIRVMCSGRVDPQLVLDAFAKGADGVLIGACHPGDCHYVDGNIKSLRRFVLLQRTLEGLGIEPERLRLEWISASEAERVRAVADEMSRQLRKLGPLSARQALPALSAVCDEDVHTDEREREADHG